MRHHVPKNVDGLTVINVTFCEDIRIKALIKALVEVDKINNTLIAIIVLMKMNEFYFSKFSSYLKLYNFNLAKQHYVYYVIENKIMSA